jgi:fructose-bisphosphate aldolase class II
MKKVCLDRYQQFWCAGNASKIKQHDINYYAVKYAKGELDPKTAVAA